MSFSSWLLRFSDRIGRRVLRESQIAYKYEKLKLSKGLVGHRGMDLRLYAEARALQETEDRCREVKPEEG